MTPAERPSIHTSIPGWDSQQGFDLRFDWGQSGVARLAPHVRTLVIVDVLRFTTAVETAVAHGVVVYPYRWRDASAKDFAASVNATLALHRHDDNPSLSPTSLTRLEPGSRVVLPSTNGAACALTAVESGTTVVAGCLRNARAVARSLESAARPIGVIACGETDLDGLMRPALEDLIGAGAVLAAVSGSRSPEAAGAVAVYSQLASSLTETLLECASARQLLEYGWDDDVDWSLAVDVSEAVPVLKDGCFVQAGGSG